MRSSVNMHRRLTLLEQRVTGDQITLHMPGGRVELLRGADRAIALLAGVFRGDRTSEIELVAKSVSSTEPDGAHLVDLARAILNSTIEEHHRPS